LPFCFVYRLCAIIDGAEPLAPFWLGVPSKLSVGALCTCHHPFAPPRLSLTQDTAPHYRFLFLERDASGSRDIELAGVEGMAGWRTGGHAWKNVATT